MVKCVAFVFPCYFFWRWSWGINNYKLSAISFGKIKFSTKTTFGLLAWQIRVKVNQIGTSLRSINAQYVAMCMFYLAKTESHFLDTPCK